MGILKDLFGLFPKGNAVTITYPVCGEDEERCIAGVVPQCVLTMDADELRLKAEFVCPNEDLTGDETWPMTGFFANCPLGRHENGRKDDAVILVKPEDLPAAMQWVANRLTEAKLPSSKLGNFFG